MNFKSFKKELKHNLEDFKSIKTLYRQIPNILTSFRIIAPIPINILFFTGNIVGSLGVVAAAFLTDAFDGFIARKLKVVSKFGADLDAVSDKVLIGGMALPIVISNPVMIINIVLEALIAATNVKAKLDNKNPKSSRMGKIKTVILSLTVIAGYFTAIYNLSIPALVALLSIAPATICQALALAGYLKTNSNNIHEPVVMPENEEKTTKQPEEVKSSEKSLQIEKKKENVTIEDLRKLKKDLTSKPIEEKGRAKTKNLSNEQKNPY